MKRNIVIATLAAAALIGGGTATAIAVAGDDEAPAQRSAGVQTKDDDREDDGPDDADDATGKDAADDRDDDGTDDERRAGNGRDDDAGVKAAGLTAAEAVEAALKHTSGTAVAAELDTEHRNLVWDVEIVTANDAWRSVWVDPATGKVLDSRDEHEDAADTEDAAEARAALKGSSVPAAEAARAAAAKGTVTQLDLDGDDRTPTWDIDTTGADGTESEWTVGLDRATVTADRSSDD